MNWNPGPDDEQALRSYDDLAEHGYGERDEEREQRNEEADGMEEDSDDSE